ncbi:Na(+)-translocating NADH-quinone reductase subunit C [Neptunicella sp. SCSIO 80796]|uniref:Na(+)-translocating NADH-quinone reductase subunit C n=1 Tax=Neptunicella plasticusilytica TaxID=3117012 RepID=UPI003A4D5688
MSANKETLGKTLGVVLAVCLVCSIIVSGSAVGLRELQEHNAKLDKQTNILEAAGLLAEAKGNIPATYAQFIEERYVDLASGEYVDMPAGYDMYKAARDPEQSVKPQPDTASLIRRANVASVYLVKDEAGNTQRIILPVNGSGLWNMMYGFLAIDNDGNTVRELVYYDQKETPGLGGEVQNPKWKALWDGKKLFKDGEVAIKVTKNAGSDNPYAVDALSGATLTSKGVQNTLDYWLGKEGFGPFLNNLKRG